MSVSGTGNLGDIAFSPEGEGVDRIRACGCPTACGLPRLRLDLRRPGLYEQVFYRELAMSSSHRVVGWLLEALSQVGRQPADERVVDLGAGNGLGGEELRRVGVRRIVGIDLEPEARRAAHRDRLGVYDDYLVSDLASMLRGGAGDRDRHAADHGPRPLRSRAGHAPPVVLDRVFALLPRAGLSPSR